MKRDADGKYHGFFREACSILGCGRKIWHLIPPRPKTTFLIATIFMFFASVCNVAFPLLLGQLVDLAKNSGDHERWVLLRGAAILLGMIGGLYRPRTYHDESGRYYVESACARVEQPSVSKCVIGHLL